ncbi:oxidative stress defense protein [Vibrio sp. B1Z05]|uniref:oxidative stress defense protein n=1 Tax=Vibrio sp. B1Z05 TaxID=2654980 RepID=UPI00128BA510|nr:oxidative stress defense protein [Vibrio sp. B1Z05]MPW34918.1 oxidative stress defense protein [Vibrio sp. B1Z05]
MKKSNAITHWFLGIVLAGCSLVVQAQAINFPHINTTGYAEVLAEPDMAEFSVQVVMVQDSAEQAKQKTDKVVDDFLQQLQALGLPREDIRSGNIQLLPQMHYPKNAKPEQKGYRAVRKVKVTIDNLEMLPKLLDVALKSGINRIDKVQLGVKDPSKYQAVARSEAIKDAKLKAESIAEGFDRTLGEVWQVNYQSPQVRPMLSRSMAMDSSERANSYQDTTIVIKDRVDVVYKLK